MDVGWGDFTEEDEILMSLAGSYRSFVPTKKSYDPMIPLSHTRPSKIHICKVAGPLPQKFAQIHERRSFRCFAAF